MTPNNKRLLAFIDRLLEIGSFPLSYAPEILQEREDIEMLLDKDAVEAVISKEDPVFTKTSSNMPDSVKVNTGSQTALTPDDPDDLPF